jgi:hypothetical protein
MYSVPFFMLYALNRVFCSVIRFALFICSRFPYNSNIVIKKDLNRFKELIYVYHHCRSVKDILRKHSVC